MKKILTTLLLTTSLCGVGVAAEVRDSPLSPEARTVSGSGNTLNPSLVQRWRRQRRHRARRNVRRHRNNGRWSSQRRSNGSWNPRRRRARRGGGHVMH